MVAVMAGGTGRLGREIVLGLLIEEPGSGYQLEKRLRERFDSCDYAEGTARHTLGRLRQLGLARPATTATRLPRSREAMAWEATAAGVAAFRSWMRESISTPPMREELHAKIALCQPRDLPRLIEAVREAERVCLFQLQAANERIGRRRDALAERAWAASMDLVVAAGEKAWWDSRIKWLQGVRIFLSQELADTAAEPSRQG